MSSVSSPSLSYSSTLTVSHQWNPRQVLNLAGDGCCVGLVLKKKRKCLNRIHRETVHVFNNILIDLSFQPLDAAILGPMLERLAQNGLCKRYHRRSQAEYMVREWTIKINDAAQSAELAAAAQRNRPDTQSTTTSFASPQPPRIPATHGFGRRVSVTASTILSINAERGSEPIQGGTEGVYEQTYTVERLPEQLQNYDLPRIDPDRSVAQVPTADSRRRPSQTLSTALSAESLQTTHNGSSTTSSRSTSPTRPTSSQSSSFSSSSSSSPPSSPSPTSSPPISPIRRTQPVSSTHTTSAGNPTTLTRSTQEFTVSSCTTVQVRRLSFSDECSICCSGEPLSSHPASELQWCTSSCGRTMHRSCLGEWATQCQNENWNFSCPFCRADWTKSCGCGGLSECDIVHVTKRSVEGLCNVCREDMGSDEDEELEWCKDGCGQSVHKSCADTWAACCIDGGKKPTCTSCRTEWRLGCSC